MRTRHSNSHGKIYPWLPPLKIRPELMDVVLRKLQESIVDILNANYSRPLTPDSDAESSNKSFVILDRDVPNNDAVKRVAHKWKR
jgi:hypothetical protein